MVSLPNLSRSTWFIIGIWVFVIVGVPAFFFISGFIGPAVSNVVGDEPEQGVSREIVVEPITGENNVPLPRGVHILNLANTNQTVTVVVNNENKQLWKQSFNVSANSELEVLRLLAKKDVYTLEVRTSTGEYTKEKITIDKMHDQVVVNIDSNSINVTQTKEY